MRFTSTLLAALALMALPALAAPALADDEKRRTMSMTGIGEASDVPDMATISTGVVSEARTAAEALAANTRAMQAAVAGLKQLGIADRDLQTSNFSVSPTYHHDPKRNVPPKIVGYAVSNQLTVVVRDLESLGPVLDKVVRDGANQISGPNFGFTKPRELMDIARARAAADAERKAGLYAKALGLELGPIVSISEETHSPRPQPIHARMAAMESAGGPPPIESGELTLNIRVNVVWEVR